MYGTPYGSLDIKAKIVDNNDSPLNDTKISAATLNEPRHKKNSDVSGNIDTIMTRAPRGPLLTETFFVYYAKDNPSQEGKYSDDSIRITPVKLEDAEDWYWGKYKLEGTLKLKEKPAESE